MSTPRLMGFKTEAAIAAILDAARSIALAEARARRYGQDPDAARLRALQRFHDTARDEYRRLPEASRRVVWRRVLAALAHPADATEAVIRQLHELSEAHRAEQRRLMREPWSIEIAEAQDRTERAYLERRAALLASLPPPGRPGGQAA